MNRPLTTSEVAVLTGAARGLGVAATASSLGSKDKTVSAQRRSICDKLGALNITHAVAIAYERGLLGTVGGREERRPEPIGPKQNSAIHARGEECDRLASDPAGTSRRHALLLAGQHFEREIAHTNELTYEEASWILDHLDAVRTQLRAGAPA